MNYALLFGVVAVKDMQGAVEGALVVNFLYLWASAAVMGSEHPDVVRTVQGESGGRAYGALPLTPLPLPCPSLCHAAPFWAHEVRTSHSARRTSRPPPHSTFERAAYKTL